MKQITGILRTNKLDLEKRTERSIPLDHPVMTWLAEYSAWMITVRVVGTDGAVAYERVRRKPFLKRLLPFGELVHVHLPLDGPAQTKRGALDSRAVDGVMLGYGDTSHSYLVWLPHLQQVLPMRSVTRRPLSQRWDAAALEAITATKKGQHGGRGARAVPFARRQQVDAQPEEPRLLGRRAARRLELRQRDFDPAMGGHGWTEHCPKCDRARFYGWQKAIQMQHSDACRTRIELALQQTERGNERLEHAKLRVDRRRAVPAAPANDDNLEPAVAEGEISSTGAAGDPTKNLDVEMTDSEEEDSDDDMQYSPASLGSPTTPMSVQHLNDPNHIKPRHTTETKGLPDERRSRLP